MEPGLLAQYPRAADLRVIRGLEVLAEGAVVVTAQRRDEEEAVLPPCFLLHVHADRGIGLIGLQAVPRRTTGDGRDRRGRKRRTSRRDGARLPAIVLEADRRREIQHVAEGVLR